MAQKPTMTEINHDLDAGDELIDTNTGTRISVSEVRSDGSVKVKAWTGEIGESEYTSDVWGHLETVTALTDGIVETPSGKSHELVNHF